MKKTLLNIIIFITTITLNLSSQIKLELNNEINLLGFSFANDDNYLYVIDFSKNVIIKISLITGNQIKIIAPPNDIEQIKEHNVVKYDTKIFSISNDENRNIYVITELQIINEIEIWNENTKTYQIFNKLDKKYYVYQLYGDNFINKQELKNSKYHFQAFYVSKYKEKTFGQIIVGNIGACDDSFKFKDDFYLLSILEDTNSAYLHNKMLESLLGYPIPSNVGGKFFTFNDRIYYFSKPYIPPIYYDLCDNSIGIIDLKYQNLCFKNLIFFYPNCIENKDSVVFKDLKLIGNKLFMLNFRRGKFSYKDNIYNIQILKFNLDLKFLKRFDFFFNKIKIEDIHIINFKNNCYFIIKDYLHYWLVHFDELKKFE